MTYFYVWMNCEKVAYFPIWIINMFGRLFVLKRFIFKLAYFKSYRKINWLIFWNKLSWVRRGTPPFLSLLFSLPLPYHSFSSHLMVIMSHLSHNSFHLQYTQSHPLLSHHSRLRKESPTFTKKLEGTKTCQENLELFFFINHKLLFYSKINYIILINHIKTSYFNQYFHRFNDYNCLFYFIPWFLSFSFSFFWH